MLKQVQGKECFGKYVDYIPLFIKQYIISSHCGSHLFCFS